MDPETLYNNVFGPEAAKNQQHRSNYQCVKNLIGDVHEIVDEFLEEVGDILNTRLDAAREIHPRNKRTLATGIAITLGLANLGSQTLSAIYFENRYEKLWEFVSQVSAQVESDAEFSKNLDQNLRLVYNKTAIVAGRTNILLLNLNKLKTKSACDMAVTLRQFQLGGLSSYLNLISNDLAMGLISPRVLPPKLMVQLGKEAKLFDGTILQIDPMIFYKQGQLTLLNYNKDRRTITVLLTFPFIEKSGSYVQLNFLNPATLIKNHNNFVEVKIEGPPVSLALPLSMVRQENFSLKTLTNTQLRQVKIPSECGAFLSLSWCKNFLPADARDLSCLNELLHPKTDLTSCRITISASLENNSISLKRGIQGSLVSAPDRATIVGSSQGVKAILHHPRDNDNVGTCSFIPNHFSTLTISLEGQTVELNQTPRLEVHSPLRYQSTDWNYVDKALYQSVTEWEKDISKNNTVPLKFNLTMQELVREKINTQIPYQGWHISHYFGYLFWVAVVGMFILGVCWKYGKCKPPWNMGEEGEPPTLSRWWGTTQPSRERTVSIEV